CFPALTALTLTLSRPTGEGTARRVSATFQNGSIHQPTDDDSPSPVGRERAGVRVSVLHDPRTFLRESLMAIGPLGAEASGGSPSDSKIKAIESLARRDTRHHWA